MTERWILDATISDGVPPYPFCPLGEDEAVLVSLTFLSDTPPGEFAGVFHADGLDAVEAWLADHGELLRKTLSDAAMLPAGDSSGDAPEGLRRDESGLGEAPEVGS